MTYFLILLLAGGAFLAFKMSVADWRRRIIPDVYLFPFMLIGFLLVTHFPWISTPGESAVAAAFGSGLGLLVGWVFEKVKGTQTEHSPIGMGDVKLLGAGGIWLGLTGLAIAIVISCILGGIWALSNKQKYIPFAPFFLSGLIISLFAMFFLV